LVGSGGDVGASASPKDEAEAGRQGHGGGGHAAPAVAVLEREATKAVVKEVAFAKLAKILEKAPAVLVTASRGTGQEELFDQPVPLALGNDAGDVSVLEGTEAKKERGALVKILSGKSLMVG